MKVGDKVSLYKKFYSESIDYKHDMCFNFIFIPPTPPNPKNYPFSWILILGTTRFESSAFRHLT